MLDFQIPRITSESVEDNRGQFVVEPLDRGFGYTFGNSLRRVLLASLAGAAVTSVRIEGVAHEFSTIKGVTEDVTDIVLNLKGIVCRMHSDATEVEAPLVVTGPGEITARDIDLPVRRRDPQPGRAHRHARQEDQARAVPDDRPRPRLPPGRGEQVARPADRRDPDRLDLLPRPPRRLLRRAGARRPAHGLRQAHARHRDRRLDRPAGRAARGGRDPDLRACRSSPTRTGSRTCASGPGAASSTTAPAPAAACWRPAAPGGGGPMDDILIEELELGVRSYNCLKRAGIQTVGDLVSKSEGELAAIPNFGKKSIDEVIETLSQRGLTLRTTRLPAMRHQKTRHKLSRDSAHRKALLRQPLHRGHRPRADQDHRGQGQGGQARAREADHAGAQGRPARAPAGDLDPPAPRQGRDLQAVRGDRAALLGAPGRLHPDPQARPASSATRRRWSTSSWSDRSGSTHLEYDGGPFAGWARAARPSGRWPPRS